MERTLPNNIFLKKALQPHLLDALDLRRVHYCHKEWLQQNSKANIKIAAEKSAWINREALPGSLNNIKVCSTQAPLGRSVPQAGHHCHDQAFAHIGLRI